MTTLEKLFGSGIRVKLLRLFLLSPEKVFTSAEAAKIIKVPLESVSSEMRSLAALGFTKKAVRRDRFEIKKGNKIKIIWRKIEGRRLSSTFPFILALRNLLITARPISREKMTKFFRSRGKIKLVALGGIFSEDLAGGFRGDGTRLDILVVGDLKKGQADSFIRGLESEIGKELNWATLSSAEFEHRISMHDRMLRDLFDYPHEFLINKLGLE
ncbi:MAG: hypothetical protein Q7S12_02725 [bacterium]|nr:hypothetical protein [bacterium]